MTTPGRVGTESGNGGTPSAAPLDRGQLIAWTVESTGAIAAVAAQVGPDARVPSCPDWAVVDLLNHVARLMSGWYQYNLTRPADEDDSTISKGTAAPLPESFADRIDYLREASAQYRAKAESVDLSGTVWIILDAGSPLFWITRSAVEMALHRWDIETATGHPTRMSLPRATHAVDETLRLMWPAFLRSTSSPGRVNVAAYERPRSSTVRVGPLPDRALGLHATDSGLTWVVSSDQGRLIVDSTAPLPETTVSAPAHELELFLWGRLGQRDVSVAGDAKLVDEWHLVDQANV